MDPIALSVSQLRAAVVDKDWRERWKRGENPSCQVYAPPGTATVYGRRFHEFADKLVRELTARSDGAARLTSDELVGVAHDLGAGAFIRQLLAAGEIESAGIMTDALHRFAQRLCLLRERHPAFAGWSDVFIGQELALSNVRLETSGPRLIFVSGAMDSVRRHPSGSIEIADYKLTQGGHLELEVVQLALYARLLRSSDRSLPLRGALEYYYPRLHVTELEESNLQAVYVDLVLPALKDLATPLDSNEAGRSHGSAGFASRRLSQESAQASAGFRQGERVPQEIGARSAEPASTTAVQTVSRDLRAVTPPLVTSAPPLARPPRASERGAQPPEASAMGGSLPERRRQVDLGVSRGIKREAVTLPVAELVRHTAVVGGSGSGKTTLALNILEQVLDAGLPVILVDRKGDLCRYADPDAFLGGDPRLASLRQRLDVALFTPGHRSGRNLGVGILPPGTETLSSTDREQAYSIASQSLASMMNYKQGATDQAKVAVLKCALSALAEHGPSSAITLSDLIRFINSEDPALMGAIGALNPKHCSSVGENLQTLEIMQGELLAADEEMLSAELLLGLDPEPESGKTRLSIISTKFLGDDKTALFWVAQLLVELSRFAGRHPDSNLQGVVMFDEADLYLPATSKPITKAPMENLLKRARSAGLGVMLATQSPGDLDYKCRENVRTWFMGLVKEKTALEKLKPMASEANFDAASLLPKQKVGQFFMVAEKDSLPFESHRSLMETEQLPETRILDLARRTREAR